ncbi:MAG: LuxR family transcriptional regulator [Rhodobacteraceae bacterium]|nr:LuxR family transcriptional regulator [Paracoccaceae bacterium]
MRQPSDIIAFSELATAGFYVAVRVGFAFPLAEYNRLPVPWVEYYTHNGLMLDDPVVRWVYNHTGATRWSAITGADPRGVLALARSYGLKFGAAIACTDGGQDGQRSYGTFARADREFTDAEVGRLHTGVQSLHDSMVAPSNLTRAELEVLRMVRDGLKLREAATLLGITEGAVKQRLKNARLKLGARNGSHAVSLASGAGLI